MEDNIILEQNENDKGNKMENDKTFNKLKRIQSLLRKESALIEICKKIQI